MRIINLFSKSVLTISIAMSSGLAIAHEGHQMGISDSASATNVSSNNSVVTDKTDHSMHEMVTTSRDYDAESSHQGHDHRKEHGAQIYAVTTVDNKWLVNEDGSGALKSKLETRIGTDENKIFIKLHADKHESEDMKFDAKVLYSRMISDFWDAQAGVRYRYEKVELGQDRKDIEEKLDGVFGLHGMAPYFFETDAYLYAGEDNFSGFSLETERDLLLTQKLIVKPYLELDVVFSDDSKYAQKTGLSSATVGLETRYEINKKVMPYIDVAYAYAKGNQQTAWQDISSSEKGWNYGVGLRFKF
ncbi:copper resistance protein B [Acinetobacter sp. ANC 4648]|uniref:copper resistance protein B n=1 Tax=Acinetobacter sp. ANC 4648 TaxID=1977875 RepID=UPI000A34204A|nr:copper resistance protein B [Acinetobacter sp. ANC 4648]OTG79806.1 copper resistance protein CopB [Acinetobacter sp. ANC 4648]